jgi:1A family penicillin-binding protein
VAGGGGPRRRRLRWGRLLLLVGAFAALALTATTGSLLAKSVATLPALDSPTHTRGETSVIYDAAGQAVADVPSTVIRQPVPLSQIPPVLQDAVIASEDRYFYEDRGFNLRGILRAAFADLRGLPLQGGSTITQQLAKQLYLSSRDTLTRKIKEAILGLELAHTYSHQQILDMYLNWVYLGSHAYGVQAASEVYFGKPVSQVTLPEAALLAGLLPAPSAYDPQVNPQLALQRRNTVLDLMAQQHYITAAQATAAVAAPLGVQAAAASPAATYPYPWYVDEVLTLLETKYHFTPQQLATGGLKIYTALNPTVYDAAQAAVTKEMNADFPATVDGRTVSDPMQAALVLMDQENGDVLAIIGGRTHSAPMAFDRATQAEEQTGSAIKPLVDYIPALEKGYTAGTTVNDVVHVYNMGPGQPPYIPTNYDHYYYGPTTFTEALRRSVNAVAVQVLNRVGVAFGVRTAERLGLVDLHLSENDHLAVALGGTVGCCTPLEMADAYATIANGGLRVTPRFVTKVVGPDGKVLLQVPVQSTRVLSPQIAYVMTKMLETVDMPQPDQGWDMLHGIYGTDWGTGYDAQVQDNVPGWPEAAKTGTTNSDRQAWYMAYTPLYTGAVYVGQDTPQRNVNLFGDLYAGPILRATMEAALQGQAPVHFPRPGGIVEAPIDIYAAPWHVAKPGPLTPARYVREEWFVAGTQPTKTSTLWEKVSVDPEDGNTLWRPGCPGTPVSRVFLNVGSKYTPAWAQGIARELGTSDWQQFLPFDLRLAPPTAWCQGPGLPTTPASGVAPASGAAGAAPSGVPATPPPAGACVVRWTVGVGTGGALSPDALCVPAGQAATIGFFSANGRSHVLRVSGLGQTIVVPATGTPVGVSFQAGAPASFAIVDVTTGQAVGAIWAEDTGPATALLPARGPAAPA